MAVLDRAYINVQGRSNKDGCVCVGGGLLFLSNVSSHSLYAVPLPVCLNVFNFRILKIHRTNFNQTPLLKNVSILPNRQKAFSDVEKFKFVQMNGGALFRGEIHVLATVNVH